MKFCIDALRRDAVSAACRASIFFPTRPLQRISDECDDFLMRLHIPLDLADEVKDESLLGDTEDLGVDILGFIVAEHIIAFAISVIVRIIFDINQAVVAHTT